MEDRDKIVQTFFEFVVKNPPPTDNEFSRLTHMATFIQKIYDVYDAGYNNRKKEEAQKDPLQLTNLNIN